MTFVCNSSDGGNVLWIVPFVGQNSPSPALDVAIRPRVETGVSMNTDNPSIITVLNAMLSDSTSTVTCRDFNGALSDSLTVYVEGENVPALVPVV